MERAFIKTLTSISIIVNNRQYIIDKTHPNYEAVSLRLKDDNWAGIENLLDIGATIERRAKGAFEVRGGAIFWNDQQINNIVVDRIVQFTQAGENYKPLLAFLENLMENPSSSSVEELYKFLEHKNLPITEDGHFLAYKAVTEDFKDKHTGTIDNSVGAKPVIRRNLVDDNRNNGCSRGLHVGSLEYVKGFSNGTTDKIIIVKVNPRDVVSVPLDCSCQKVRVCTYEVIGLYDGPLPEIIHYEDLDGLDDDWDEEEEEDVCGVCREWGVETRWNSEVGEYICGACLHEYETEEEEEEFEEETCYNCGTVLTDEDDGSCPFCDREEDSETDTLYCDVCGTAITYESSHYWDIDLKNVCPECFNELEKAEEEDSESEKPEGITWVTVK